MAEQKQCQFLQLFCQFFCSEFFFGNFDIFENSKFGGKVILQNQTLNCHKSTLKFPQSSTETEKKNTAVFIF